eukprot:CAMPEP_0181213518 /NCGR_PEP_ID=MMETSP1096-20121128/24945_1 /TAXON_ID=156174 ORGANISM="Chrysochromulina ericina, Strain CCMP281" /NCGR_SAMPLE_ID=MMETSP1096 /ASSEMBLY_ACC=CAM_ASM_000453 /LENGTH=194 /DNA_ID=CAMNT_0023305157 /DNA_START=326 /DNA_END=910 /DNA_ORIENTATION=-
MFAEGWEGCRRMARAIIEVLNSCTDGAVANVGRALASLKLRFKERVERLDRFDHAGGERLLWVVIACRVIGPLGDLDELHNPVFNVESKALAPPDDTFPIRAGVDQLHPEAFGEDSRRVAHHRDELLLVDTLVLRPGIHHRAIVDTVDDHLIDAELLQGVHFLKIARHLTRGSGGRKSAGKPDDEDLLARNTLH